MQAIKANIAELIILVGTCRVKNLDLAKNIELWFVAVLLPRRLIYIKISSGSLGYQLDDEIYRDHRKLYS